MNPQEPRPHKRTLYELAGGDSAFTALVDRFYVGVEQDTILRPMYPGEDLTAAKRHLALFLMQYFGGPTTYSDERGHPRLRARHMPFPIDKAARDAWMHHMRAAVETGGFAPEIKSAMLDYFEQAATFMINQFKFGANPT